ncbi:unnamed protein product [Merluccius merluccius]
MVVRRMGVGYKRSWFLGKRHSVNVSFKIFCGWDFTIQDPDAAGFKHSSIRNDLKLYLEEQNFNLREAQRTLIQWVGLYTLRVTLNLIVLFLLGGAFYLIQYTTLRKEPKIEPHNFGWFWRNMLNQYLPAITIALINLIIPHIFRKISSFEDYSLTTQVNATLMRSSFLKLASLGMLLFFFIQTGPQQCWENQFGREMYKLYMFDFIINICRMLLLDYPTMLLKERCPSCWLARLSGKQRFLVPFNVLDLVYNQTVLWAGVFYCPVLPFLGIVKLVAVFFFKKFKVLRCCVPEERLFRASSASFFFHFMLLLGLFMTAGMLGHDRIISKPSSCGPFDGGASIANVTSVCVASLPGPAQNTLNTVASYSFAMLLILIEILVFTFLVVLGRANRRAIDRLKNQLVICSSNRFLEKQYMLVITSDPTVLYEGSRLVLSCDATVESQLSYTWFFNRKNVMNLTSPSLHPTGSKLVVEQVTSLHAGAYSCMTQSMRKEKRSSSSREVQVVVKVYLSQPQISFSISKGANGYVGNVTCWTSRGSPPATFSLFLDGKQVASFIATESTLVTFPVAIELAIDNGMAECLVRTEVQELKSKTLTLVVGRNDTSVRF